MVLVSRLCVLVLVCGQLAWSDPGTETRRRGGSGRLASVVQGYPGAPAARAFVATRTSHVSKGVARVQLLSPDQEGVTEQAPAPPYEPDPISPIPPAPGSLSLEPTADHVAQMTTAVTGPGCGLMGPTGWSECCEPVECRVDCWRRGRLFCRGRRPCGAWLLGPEVPAIEMRPHELYGANEHYHYFRPYNPAHVRELQSAAIRDVGADPRLPWARGPFADLYESFDESLDAPELDETPPNPTLPTSTIPARSASE